MRKIKFGTDGWRARIAEEFTFDNLRIIAQAVSDYLKNEGKAEQGVAVSYDTRFLSPEFARSCAEVLAANGIPVYLSSSYTPTPVLSYAVKQRRLAGGIMITASHNPSQYSGVKFKGDYGGSAMEAITRSIEKQLYRTPPAYFQNGIGGAIFEVDFFTDYLAHLQNFIRFDLISTFPGKIVLDSMGGAGAVFLSRLLDLGAVSYAEIDAGPDPLFHGKLPEPVLKNLSALSAAVREEKASLGLATDGDADRFGVLDENGEFVELHDLMPLLFEYLIESRGWSGNAVRTTSMHNTIDRVAAEHHREVTEVPVGFKNVCERMLENDVLIGGEESGGFGYKNHIPERDGLLSALLVLEMLAYKKTSIREMVRELRRKYGSFHYGRIDHYLDQHILSQNLDRLRQSPPQEIGGFKVERVSLIDGIKFYFTEKAWTLMRVSQTEPLGRVYVGADCQENVEKILKAGLRLLTGGTSK